MAVDNLKFAERGLLRPELFVGVLSYVSAQAVRFNVDAAGNPSATHYNGGRYGKGEVGEFVLIEGQVSHLLGRFVELRLPERDRRAVNPGSESHYDLDAVGTIQLFGSVAIDTLCVTSGVQAYPRLGDRVYLAPHPMLAHLPLLMEANTETKPDILLTLGSIDVAKDSAVSVKPEKLFGRHCAILGATGGGKSWTTARVIAECIKYKAKIILLDATGEYRGIGGQHVQHCYLGAPPQTFGYPNDQKASLPPTSFLESDLIAMFEPSGRIQGPKLREAIRSLKLASLRPQLATDGWIIKFNKPKKPIQDAEIQLATELDNPETRFDVAKLARQLYYECAQPDSGFGQNQNPNNWGPLNIQDYNYCLGLCTRILAVTKSPTFDFVFRETNNPLSAKIETFTADANSRLLRICLVGVSHEYKAREIVANVIGRKLLLLARQGKFLDKPLVVFLDEAHSFLGRHIGSEETVAKLDAFELIAKEGRKYGLNIVLATQRPRDITEGVLSQMGTLIVHRLTNDRDREVVERACGEIDRAAASFLPTLRPGEAAIIGADFPIPLTIQILPPDTKPKSDGPKYQEKWK